MAYRTERTCRFSYLVPYAMILLLILFISSPCAAAPYKIVHVIDAITIKAATSTGDLDIRLVGIESPEIIKADKQAGNRPTSAARLFLAKLVLNKTVDIQSYGYNVYNQMLAVVHAGDINVNLEMVKAGMARVKKDKTPPNLDLSLFRQAEAEAREAKIGLWAVIQPEREKDSKVTQGRGREERITVYEYSGPEKATPTAPVPADMTVAKRIEFELGDEKETVFVYLEDFAVTKAFDLNGKKPRIVIDIRNISQWRGKRLIPVNGKWIRRIRTYLHKDTKKLRIVLDLRIDASRDYSVSQLFDMKKSMYQLEISPVR